MITPSEYEKLMSENSSQEFQINTLKRLLIALPKARGGKIEINRWDMEDAEPDKDDVLLWRDDMSNKYVICLKSTIDEK